MSLSINPKEPTKHLGRLQQVDPFIGSLFNNRLLIEAAFKENPI
jgi:hypothetical protein